MVYDVYCMVYCVVYNTPQSLLEYVRERNTLKLILDDGVTLTPMPDEGLTRNYRLIFLMNTDAKILFKLQTESRNL